ncbi:hypothetical protein D779_0495 [Imhoffiella purpurea]|uniref:Uncharacterized protein n=1 Tax=Imhoffiella purpurea TaxID=1249627 RepID=W9W0Q1_9GAMM|nr:hypothetical protein D779_0495 [Imhoffiella purpurea]
MQPEYSMGFFMAMFALADSLATRPKAFAASCGWHPWPS